MNLKWHNISKLLIALVLIIFGMLISKYFTMVRLEHEHREQIKELSMIIGECNYKVYRLESELTTAMDRFHIFMPTDADMKRLELEKDNIIPVTVNQSISELKVPKPSWKFRLMKIVLFLSSVAAVVWLIKILNRK